MSITAVILIKAKPGWGMNPAIGAWCLPLIPETPEDPTHEIDPEEMLYTIDYARGHWPTIAGYLMTLMADKSVEWVRYGHGHGDGLPPLMTPARLFEITAHWLEHGTRPYDEARETHMQ